MIEKPLDLGVRAINGLLTCGKGQRVESWQGPELESLSYWG